MIEGSGSGSVVRTTGSGSGGPKNTRILRIRIRNSGRNERATIHAPWTKKNNSTSLLTREETVETGAEPLSQRHKMRLVHGEEEGANIQRGIGEQREQAGRVDEQLGRQPVNSVLSLLWIKTFWFGIRNILSRSLEKLSKGLERCVMDQELSGFRNRNNLSQSNLFDRSFLVQCTQYLRRQWSHLVKNLILITGTGT
jgi:hypothetical protein